MQEGKPPSEIEVTLLDCVFYPSVNAFVSWSTLRLSGLALGLNLLSKGTLMYGNDEVLENVTRNMQLIHESRVLPVAIMTGLVLLS